MNKHPVRESVFAEAPSINKRGTLYQLRSRRHMTKAAAISLLLGTTFLTPGILPKAHALPQNGQVRHGDVTISLPDPDTLMLDQRSTSAIIDWDSFDLDTNDRFLVFQPTDDSWLLNRVNGGTVSTILGEIQANGGLVLVNPNGITLGNGARINAGSLIMTTSDISDENFLNRNFVFDRPGSPLARIWNKGTLEARAGGLVALVAPGVENDGIITANLGQIAIGAGNTFTLDLYGDNLIRFGVSDELLNEVAGDVLRNSGVLQATGGRIVLDASGAARAVDQVLNMDGYIEANSAIEQNGEIVLFGGEGTVLVSGTIEAQGNNAGETGGDIDVRGRHTGLMNEGILNASGHSGGGRIALGGDYQGGRTPTPEGFKQPKEFQSDATYVASSARIDVRAINRGDGGIATVWADKVTRFLGEIDGRGGDQGGNGGFAEVSGLEQLIFEGTAMMSAVAGGTNGTLLLDPTSITISTFDSNITVTGGVFDAAAGGGSFLSVSTLGAQMDASNVTITTGGTSFGTIVFDSAFTHTNNTNNLTLSATGFSSNIVLNAPIDVGGDLTIDSGGNIQMNTGVIQAAGNLVINANGGSGFITVQSNSAAFTAIDIAISGTLESEAGEFNGIVLSAPTVTLNQSFIGPSSLSLGSIDLTAATTTTFNGNFYEVTGAFNAPNTVVLTQSNTTLAGNTIVTLGTVQGSGSQDLTIYSGLTPVTVGSLGVSGNELNNVFIQSVSAMTISTGAETLGSFNVTNTNTVNLNGTINIGGTTNIAANTINNTAIFTGADHMNFSAPTGFTNTGTITAQDRPVSMSGGSIDISTDSFSNASGLIVTEDFTGGSGNGPGELGFVAIQTTSTPLTIGAASTMTAADINGNLRIDSHELILRTFNGDLTVNEAFTHEGFLSLSASGNFNVNAVVAVTPQSGIERTGLNFDAINGTSTSTLDIGSAQLLGASIANVTADEISFIADDGVSLNTPITGFKRLHIQADKDMDGTGTLFLNNSITLGAQTVNDVDVNGNAITVSEGGEVRFEAATYSIGALTIDVSPDMGAGTNEFRYGATELFFTNTNSVQVNGIDLSAAELGSFGERVRIFAKDDILFDVAATDQQIELIADAGEHGGPGDGNGDVILGSSASINNSSFSVSGQVFDRSIAFIGNDFDFNAAASIHSQNIRIGSFSSSFTIGSGGILDNAELQTLSGNSLYMVNVDPSVASGFHCDYPFPDEANCFNGTLTLDNIAAGDFIGFTKSLFFAADDIVVGPGTTVLPTLTGSDPFLFGNNVMFSATDDITISGTLNASNIPSTKFLADADGDNVGDVTVQSAGSLNAIDVTFDAHNIALPGSFVGDDVIMVATNNATASTLSATSLSLDSAFATLNGSINGQVGSTAAPLVTFVGVQANGAHFMNGTLIPSAQIAPTPSPGPTPTPAPSPEPTVEPTPEPTAQPTPEPTPGPTVPPTPEPTPPPTPEPTPTPVDVITNPDGSLDGGAVIPTDTPLDDTLADAIADDIIGNSGASEDTATQELVREVADLLGETGDGSATVDEIIQTIELIDQTIEQTEDTGENLEGNPENEEDEEKEEQLKKAVNVDAVEGQYGTVEVFDPADSGVSIDVDDEDGFTPQNCQC